MTRPQNERTRKSERCIAGEMHRYRTRRESTTLGLIGALAPPVGSLDRPTCVPSSQSLNSGTNQCRFQNCKPMLRFRGSNKVESNAEKSNKVESNAEKTCVVPKQILLLRFLPHRSLPTSLRSCRRAAGERPASSRPAAGDGEQPASATINISLN